MNNRDLTRLNAEIACGSKKSYATEDEARTASESVLNLFRSKQWPYLCCWCGEWHLTVKSPKAQEAIKRGLKNKGII